MNLNFEFISPDSIEVSDEMPLKPEAQVIHPCDPSTYVYKLTMAYDGTHYGGWQIQNNTLSIQDVIQKTLTTILRKKTAVIASGRTDAGVHALGQVAHFKHPEFLSVSKLLLSLNALLPADIRILDIAIAPPSFHARFSAVSKLYHYYLHLDAAEDPFQHLYTYCPPHYVDLSVLTNAAHCFIGTHDFTSFANVRGRGTPNKKKGRELVKPLLSNIRTIHSLEIKKTKKGVCLCFEGNGFLYKMVRNIVGTLLNVCSGKIHISDIERIFAAKDRRVAGIAAPPHGLFLMEVKYNRPKS